MEIIKLLTELYHSGEKIEVEYEEDTAKKIIGQVAGAPEGTMIKVIWRNYSGDHVKLIEIEKIKKIMRSKDGSEIHP